MSKIVHKFIRKIRNKVAPAPPAFQPYEIPLDVHGLDGRFIVATPQARTWYDPLKSYAKLEYEWVIDNIALEHQQIVDAGSHHGQYSVVFALASNHTSQIVAVDPFPTNCLLTEANLRLNDARAEIRQCAISDADHHVQFSNEPNGQIVDTGGVRVESCRLETTMPGANVVKLDIEGAEYSILPESIERLESAHSWIVEIHPVGRPHPDTIIRSFMHHGFRIKWVNRADLCVEEYSLGQEWHSHSTMFATR